MKTQKRHLVILLALLGLLGWSNTAHADVYWDFVNGVVGNTGETPAKALKNWSEAKNRLAAQIIGGNTEACIIVMDTISLGFEFGMDGTLYSGSTVIGYAKVKRYAGFTKPMFILRKNDGGLKLSNVTISGECQGATPHPTTTSSIIYMREGTTLTINDGTVLRDNWNYATSGGAVYAHEYATVVMNGGTITGCKSSDNGGAIALSSYPTATDDPNVDKTSSFTMNGGIIEECVGHFLDLNSGYGGGVFIAGKRVTISGEPTIYYATLDLKGGKIRNCESSRAGGFYAERTTVSLEGTEISGNTCRHYGGGAYISVSEVTMSAGSVINNIAGSELEEEAGSGGLSLVHTPMTMTGGTISGNCSAVGGGIGTAYEESIVTISGGIISNNIAYSKGGALNMNVGGTVIIPSGSDVLIEGNHSNIGGGFCLDGAYADIQAGVFRNNGATDAYISPDPEDPYPHGFGGAIYIQCKNNANTHASVVSISGATFVNNRATKSGGAIYLQEVTSEHDPAIEEKNSVSVSNCTFTANQALENDGGAIYINDGDLTVAGCDIRNNEANVNGGAIYFDATSTMTVGSGTLTIKDNTGNSVPNNVYLMTGNIINITDGASFNPAYVGIYPQGTATVGNPIHVFSGTNEQVSYIYRTCYVVDDSQRFYPLYPGSGTTYDFGVSPWSPLQQTVNTLPTKVNDVYQIGTVEDLTAFLWLVNNIDTHHNFNTDLSEAETTHPEASAKLTADIDMQGHYWVPIANYTGTFDGNGYLIKNLAMVPSNGSAERGLFGVNTSGTIKNVNLRDGYFVSGGSYIGSIVSQMNGGSLYNSVAQCQLTATATTTTAGGLVGYLNGGTVHSSIATCEMTGYTMGGLAGKIGSTGNLYNSFANPLFHYTSGSYFVGGLVAENAGTVANCYVRFSRTQTLTGANFGQLAGRNTGTITACYTPEVYSVPATIIYSPSSSTGETYKVVDAPYLYNRTNDNLVGSTPLYKKLNEWVSGTINTIAELAYWNRTTAGGWSYSYGSPAVTYTGGNLNDDYPMPKMVGLSNVASADGLYLDYSPCLSRVITQYNGLTGGGTIWLYASPKNATGADEAVNVDNDSDVLLYIDEDATLLQAAGNSLTAYTGQTLRTYSSAGGNRWHFLSSPLKQSYIGISYTATGYVGFNWDPDPCGVQFSGNEDQALFPHDMPVAAFDLYSFYEPQYHWINFRRRSDSHWHEDGDHEQIIYEGNGIEPINASNPDDPSNGNETYLVPGKGYLVSINVDQLVQNKGELNNEDVTLYNVTKTDDNAWAERLGFNLLGNPYQSYLNFEAFITENSTNLWSGTSEYTGTYACYDPSLKSYVQYKSGVSYGAYAASQYIHPHQGFFIRMTKGSNSTNTTAVTYTNTMRVATLPDGISSTFRGGNQPAYPLINLMVRDSEGNGDVAVLELGRDTDEGAEKMRLGDCTGALSLGYQGKEYGILFRTEIGEYQSLHFTAREAGTFTLTWQPMNGEFSELTLVDNIAGTRTDMLAHDSYVFEGNPDQYASRFKIVIGDYKDIEENEAPEPVEGPTFAFQMGDELVVNGEGRLEVVDMLGRIVRTVQLQGSQSTVRKPETTGVYVLRLTDQNRARTQKIVIE